MLKRNRLLWSANHAIQFCRRRHKFTWLIEFVDPLAAQQEKIKQKTWGLFLWGKKGATTAVNHK